MLINEMQFPEDGQRTDRTEGMATDRHLIKQKPMKSSIVQSGREGGQNEHDKNNGLYADN